MSQKMVKVEMTDSEKMALRHILPFCIGGKSKFTPDIFDGLEVSKKYQPVFTVRTMTREEYLISVEAKNTNDFDALKDMAVSVCVGWENLWNTDNDKPVIVNYSKESCKDVLNSSAVAIWISIVNESMRISGLQGIERIVLK